MNKTIIKELFSAHRTNRFRYEDDKDEPRPAECWVVAFAAVTVTVAWAIWLEAIVRWAWKYWGN